jgi:hypothetical protein
MHTGTTRNEHNGEEPTQASGRSLAAVCTAAALTPQATALLGKGMKAREYLGLLRHADHFKDGVRFLAYWLPKRQAVWWACLCAQQVLPPGAPASVSEALRTAQGWTREPSEENRRAALPAAEAAGLDTPAGCAALAAFLSLGSMAPADVPPVAPPPHAAAEAVIGAAMLAAVIHEPHKASEKYRLLLDLGIEVMTGTATWDRSHGDT